MSVEIKITGADAQKLRQWHDGNGADARLSESIAKSVLEQYIRDTGSPNGAEIACGEKFYVK